MTTRDTVIDLDVERPVAGGRMLARHQGRVVLVSGAIPGERVRARVERTTRQVMLADTTEVIEPSPDRRTPRGDPACGGSTYAHIAYPRQVQLKGEVVADAFRRIAKQTLDAAVPIEASPEDHYRLRARLHVRGGRAGFFREGTHHWCDAASTGQLAPDALAAVGAVLQAIAQRAAEVEAIIVSESVSGAARVLHLEPKPGARLEDLRGLVAVPAGATGVTTGDAGRLVTLAGMPTVTDTAEQIFGGPPPAPMSALAAWTRHAPSFFQGNRFLTGAVVRHVLEAAEGARFVDLYAGVGLFAVALAASGRRGLAVEGDRSSGIDLAANARPWRDELRVVRGAVEEATALALDPPPDVVVLDPPRTGASPEALQGVIAWQAPRVVYVSCDPATLARDAARLATGGYGLRSLQGFDLFPNTPHIEVVAVFDRSVRASA